MYVSLLPFFPRSPCPPSLQSHPLNPLNPSIKSPQSLNHIPSTTSLQSNPLNPSTTSPQPHPLNPLNHIPSITSLLSRSGAGGFLLPLSGGADSSSVAAIVHVMCTLVIAEVHGDEDGEDDGMGCDGMMGWGGGMC